MGGITGKYCYDSRPDGIPKMAKVEEANVDEKHGRADPGKIPESEVSGEEKDGQADVNAKTEKEQVLDIVNLAEIHMSLLNQEDTKRRLNVYIKACEDASKMMLSSSSQCRSLIDKAMKEAESVDTVDEKNVILQLAFARIKQWSKSKSGQPFTLLVSRSSDPPLDPPVGTPSISAAISTQVSPSPRDSVSSFVNPLPSVPEGKSENILISLQGFSPPPTLPKNWSVREFSGAGDEISIMAQADGKEFEEDQGVSLSRQADKEDVTGGGEPQGDEGPKT